MALGGCYDCLKYLMFVFNFVFWLAGCALLAVGIWVKVDEKSFTDLFDHDQLKQFLGVGVYVIIAVGAIIMILGFLGCCGAIRESQCMLATFFVFLFLIFSALLAVGIFAYLQVNKDPESIQNEIAKQMSGDVKKYKDDPEARKRLDLARDEFSCCGSVRGDMLKEYPAEALLFCGKATPAAEGCASKAYEKVKKYTVVYVGTAFGIAVIMLLGMVFSMLLCCAIRETSM